MLQRWVTMMLCCLVMLVFAASAQAIPAFAKAHRMACASCHAYYPRLNDFGEQFRRGGYQIPGKLAAVTVAHSRAFPVSAALNAEYSSELGRHMESDRADGYLLSGGAISGDVSYFLRYPSFSNTSTDDTETPKIVELANMLFRDVANSGVDMRAGRFMSPFNGFGPSHHLFSTALVTSMIALDGTSDGVEVSRFFPNGVSCYFGRADWRPNMAQWRGPHGYYGRIAKSFGGGLGETEGHRIGVSAFSGHVPVPRWDPPDYQLTFLDQSLRQFSTDASFNFGRTNVSLQYSKGRHSANALLSAGDFTGKQAQIAYSLTPRWVAAAATEVQKYEETAHSFKVSHYRLESAYYPAENLRLSLQYGGWRTAASFADSGCWFGAGARLCY